MDDGAAVLLQDGFTAPEVPAGPLEAMSAMPDAIYEIPDVAARRAAIADWIDTNWHTASDEASWAFEIDDAGGRNPFRGNGFGGTGGGYLPELRYPERVQIPQGGELWRVGSDGKPELTAVFRGRQWVRVVETPTATR